MRRVNIQAAFVGEPSYGTEASAVDAGDEAVALVVRAGDLTIVVPPGTPDEGVLARATVLRGTLHLENEQVLTFEIQDGATGAFFEHEAAALHARRQEHGGVGLFTLTASPFQQAGGTVRARDLMRTAVVTVAPATPVEEVARLLAFHQITSVLVVEADRLVGIATEADVIAKSGPTVDAIMSRDVIAVGEEATADEIARLLTERRIRRVPVVRGEHPVGVVTRGDLVRWLADRSSAPDQASPHG